MDEKRPHAFVICDVLVSDVWKDNRPDLYVREPKRCGTDLILFCHGSNKNAYRLIWSDVVSNRRSEYLLL